MNCVHILAAGCQWVTEKVGNVACSTLPAAFLCKTKMLLIKCLASSDF